MSNNATIITIIFSAIDITTIISRGEKKVFGATLIPENRDFVGEECFYGSLNWNILIKTKR